MVKENEFRIRPSIENMIVVPGHGLRFFDGFETGKHTVALSGVARMSLESSSDDPPGTSVIADITIGPEWNIQVPVQVTASIAMSGIYSDDADEVDHSRWDIDTYRFDSETTSGGTGKRIRIVINLRVQGVGNFWKSVSYHATANGELLHSPNRSDVQFLP